MDSARNRNSKQPQAEEEKYNSLLPAAFAPAPPIVTDVNITLKLLYGKESPYYPDEKEMPGTLGENDNFTSEQAAHAEIYKKQISAIVNLFLKASKEYQFTKTHIENLYRFKAQITSWKHYLKQPTAFYKFVKQKLEHVAHGFLHTTQTKRESQAIMHDLLDDISHCGTGIGMLLLNTEELLLSQDTINRWLASLRTNIIKQFAEQHIKAKKIIPNNTPHVHKIFFDYACTEGWNPLGYESSQSFKEVNPNLAAITSEDINAFHHHFISRYQPVDMIIEIADVLYNKIAERIEKNTPPEPPPEKNAASESAAIQELRSGLADIAEALLQITQALHIQTKLTDSPILKYAQKTLMPTYASFTAMSDYNAFFNTLPFYSKINRLFNKLITAQVTQAKQPLCFNLSGTYYQLKSREALGKAIVALLFDEEQPLFHVEHFESVEGAITVVPGAPQFSYYEDKDQQELIPIDQALDKIGVSYLKTSLPLTQAVFLKLINSCDVKDFSNYTLQDLDFEQQENIRKCQFANAVLRNVKVSAEEVLFLFTANINREKSFLVYNDQSYPKLADLIEIYPGIDLNDLLTFALQVTDKKPLIDEIILLGVIPNQDHSNLALIQNHAQLIEAINSALITCIKAGKADLALQIFPHSRWEQISQCTEPDKNTCLHWSVKINNKELVKRLLLAGADSLCVNAEDKCTPVELAIKLYHWESVETFVDQLPEDVQANPTVSQILLAVCKYNQPQIALKLLARKLSPAQINAFEADTQNTSLHFAAAKRNASIIKVLLAAGANQNLMNRNKRTPLRRVTDENDKWDCLELFLETNILHKLQGETKDNDEVAKVAYRCVKENQQTHLLSKLLPLTLSTTYNDNQTGNFALHYAVLHNSPDIIASLLTANHSLNLVNKEQLTPFELSLLSDKSLCTEAILQLSPEQFSDTVKRLEKMRANTPTDAKIINILQTHLVNYIPTVTNILISSKEPSLATMVSVKEFAATHHCVDEEKKLTDFIEKLLKNRDKKTLYENLAEVTSANQTTTALTLLSKLSPILITDINRPIDNEKNTLLHVAAKNGNVDLVVAFLKEHADPNQRNTNKQTAILRAGKYGNGNWDCVSTLLELETKSGLKLNSEDNGRLIHSAVVDNRIDIVRKLVTREHDKNVVSAEMYHNCLHLAVRSKNPDMIALLLVYNHDANALDKDRLSPFELALSLDDDACIKAFLVFGNGNAPFESTMNFGYRADIPDKPIVNKILTTLMSYKSFAGQIHLNTTGFSKPDALPFLKTALENKDLAAAEFYLPYLQSEPSFAALDQFIYARLTTAALPEEKSPPLEIQLMLRSLELTLNKTPPHLPCIMPYVKYVPFSSHIHSLSELLPVIEELEKSIASPTSFLSRTVYDVSKSKNILSELMSAYKASLKNPDPLCCLERLKSVYDNIPTGFFGNQTIKDKLQTCLQSLVKIQLQSSDASPRPK